MPTMNNPMIHASEIAAALQCEKKALFNREQKAEPLLLPRRQEYNERLDQLLEPLHLPKGKRNDPASRSLNILEQEKCGRSLRFEAWGIRTVIPLLFEKEDGTYKAIYPVCSTAPKDTLLPLLAIDSLIAQENGIKITDYEFLYLDKNYIRQKKPYNADFFTVSDHLKKVRGGMHSIKAIEQVEQMKEEIGAKRLAALARLLQHSKATQIPALRKKACTSPQKCPWYEQCFHEDRLADNASAFLSSSSCRSELEQEGIERLGQVDALHLDGAPLQYAQIMADRYDGLFLDRSAIEKWMKQLVWPITYLDFEWDTFALAPYPGMKAFDVLCFQYSIHIEHEDGRLEHSVFFSTGDCRKDFIDHLLEEIPEKGSIMVFNMEGAEKLRLMQLADQLEDKRKPLEALCERMVDLQIPFENGSFYDIRQRGRSSLKTLLPLLSRLDGYSQLNVHNGMEAVFAYRQADASNDSLEKETIAQRICDYCSMDTYAERELFLGLKKKLEE